LCGGSCPSPPQDSGGAITIDVHARDIVHDLMKNLITRTTSTGRCSRGTSGMRAPWTCSSSRCSYPTAFIHSTTAWRYVGLGSGCCSAVCGYHSCCCVAMFFYIFQGVMTDGICRYNREPCLALNAKVGLRHRLTACAPRHIASSLIEPRGPPNERCTCMYPIVRLRQAQGAIMFITFLWISSGSLPRS
jgi:hypothetical protein